MLNYRLVDAISELAVYRGYKMLAFMFHVIPQASVLAINDYDVDNITDAVLGTDYNQTTINSVKTASLNMPKIYERLGNPYSYYMGRIDLTGWNTTYTDWYYLMCLVQPPDGLALPNSAKKTLSTEIVITLDESLLSPTQPIIQDCILFGLPVNGTCSYTNSYQTGFSSISVSN